MGRKRGIVQNCAVCGDLACGVNFGVASCMSCKTFFRRNVLLQKTQEVTCQFNDNCIIEVKTRKFCTKCRLKKCFDLGMKMEMIKSDNEKRDQQEKFRQNKIKRLEKATPEQTIKETPNQILNQQQSPSQQSNNIVNSSLIVLEPVSLLSLISNSSPTTSSTSSASTIISESSPRLNEKELETNREFNDILESLEVDSTLDDDISTFDNISTVDLSDIEVTPFESENSSKHYQLATLVPCNSDCMSHINLNGTLLEIEPEIARLIPHYNTLEHFGFPVDELTVPEQNLLLELVSAGSVMHNPYKKIENFRYNPPYCLETAEFTFYRLIKMTRQLRAFRQLSSKDQELLLKTRLITMMHIRLVMSYNPFRKAWAFVNDRFKSSVMFPLEMLKPFCIKLPYEKHANYPLLFRDEWRQDQAIFDLLTVIVLFEPNVNYQEYEKINSEQHRYIRLLHRYLQAKYPTKSEADDCFHQLMYNLKDCDLIIEDIVNYFQNFKSNYPQNTYSQHINELSN